MAGLTKKKIESAINRIEREGEEAPERLLLIAPERSADKDDVARYRAEVAKEYDLSKAEAAKLKLGRVFKAFDLANYYLFDADAVLYGTDRYGNVSYYYTTGDYHPVRPENLVIAKAEAIGPDSAEIEDFDQVVQGLMFGSYSRSRRRY